MKKGLVTWILLFTSLILFFNGCRYPLPSDINKDAPELVAVYKGNRVFTTKNIRGEFPALSVGSVLVRLKDPSSARNFSRKVSVQGVEVESISNSRPIIENLEANDKGYWWTENLGSEFAELRIAIPPSSRRNARVAVSVVNVFRLSSGVIEESSALNFTLIDPTLPSGNTGLPRVIEPSEVFFNCGPVSDHNNGQEQYYRNCRPLLNVIKKDILVAGWIGASGPGINMGCMGLEDMIVDIVLDIDFLEQQYGPNGLNQVLNNAILPGNDTNNSSTSLPPITLNNMNPSNGRDMGIDVTSFSLPDDGVGGGLLGLHCELNCWHERDTRPLISACRGFRGRGPAPEGWIRIPFNNANENFQDASWPFHPLRATRSYDPNDIELKPGDYVLMKGTLFQDHGHDNTNWMEGCSKRNTGWLEIHPIDWIEKLPPKSAKRLAASISLFHAAGECRNTPSDIVPTMTPSDLTRVFTIVPDIHLMPKGPGQTLHFREVIDGRFSDMNSVVTHQPRVVGDFLEVEVTVRKRVFINSSNLPGRSNEYIPGRFKATYILWWE
jgi:hypothetical protein